MAEDFMNHFRFNTEITPDRFALVNLQNHLLRSNKPNENLLFSRLEIQTRARTKKKLEPKKKKKINEKSKTFKFSQVFARLLCW